jgi:hypothetical protein
VSGNKQAGQRGPGQRGPGQRGAAQRGAAQRGSGPSGAGPRGPNGAGPRGGGTARGTSPGRKTAKPRRPLPQGQALYTPQASPGRRAIERRSAALLVYLHQLPRWLPAVVLAVLLIAGLAVHGIGGAIALIGVALVLGWLAVVSWPQLSPSGRVIRVLVVALVAGVAVAQAIR